MTGLGHRSLVELNFDDVGTLGCSFAWIASCGKGLVPPLLGPVIARLAVAEARRPGRWWGAGLSLISYGVMGDAELGSKFEDG